jgi:ABC-type transport system involved in multi-copper enzyme maturation permease subunit
MRQFLAILKDSFREAMDAKVIYVLLAMSGLLILFVATMSFEPAPPQAAFDQIAARFAAVFPDEGRGKVPVFLAGAKYAAEDVTDQGGGKYALRLKVTPTGDADGLRTAAANWLRPAGATRKMVVPAGLGIPAEVADPAPVTPEDLRAITDGQMEAFVKAQFAAHAGMSDVTVNRVAGVAEPNYAFDVAVNAPSAVRGWPHTTKLFFGTVTVFRESPLGLVLWILEDQVVNGVGAGLALLIGVIVTGFFIPNMLRKGALDLLIAKPIGRPALLVYKYVGGLLFVLVLAAFTVGGLWLVLGLRAGYWDPSFLFLIPILTFTFAILYAFSTLVAVFTRSAVASILLTCGLAVFLYVVGAAKVWADDRRADAARAREVPKWLATTVDALHTALPRYKDVDRLTTKLIADGTLTPLEQYALAKSKADYPNWADTFGVSLAFIALMLGLACWRFNTRDG